MRKIVWTMAPSIISNSKVDLHIEDALVQLKDEASGDSHQLQDFNIRLEYF